MKCKYEDRVLEKFLVFRFKFNYTDRPHVVVHKACDCSPHDVSRYVIVLVFGSSETRASSTSMEYSSGFPFPVTTVVAHIIARQSCLEDPAVRRGEKCQSWTRSSGVTTKW